jgi:hypothetical protein
MVYAANNIVIITGVNRGIDAAIAKIILQNKVMSYVSIY